MPAKTLIFGAKKRVSDSSKIFFSFFTCWIYFSLIVTLHKSIHFIDIFTLVDSLVLQMERFLKLSERSVGEGAIKKRSTGTVPKCKSQGQFKIDRVGHAKYTITVNPRSREPKQHNQSSK